MLGEIETPVGTFKPTLRAARTVNALGGFVEVFRRLATFDLNAYVVVAAAGLGKKSNDVEEAVYSAGLPNLVESFSEFVECLSNGGKPIKTGAKEGDDSGEA